jgi:hypothetical protein
MTKEQIALAAQSIKDNEAFQMALGAMRRDAIEELVSTNATDTDKIRDLQAHVRVVDELRANLEALIRAGQAPKAPGLV